ncbi:MAG TPA: PDZ domain-containing protein [Nitrososphaeraceae archaeon]
MKLLYAYPHTTSADNNNKSSFSGHGDVRRIKRVSLLSLLLISCLLLLHIDERMLSWASKVPKTKNFGAWASYQVPLESMSQISEQRAAINTLLKQGYTEYYFALVDFELESVRSIADNLLTAADGTGMKMIVILIPPSEAGPGGNYDWDGWIDYLNSLKEKHPSLDGFVIDDFNWHGVEEEEDEAKDNNEENDDNDDRDSDSSNNDVRYNVDFMIESELGKALEKKRDDLHFYPLIYIEGAKTNTVKRQYYNLSDGIVLASVDFYNITKLEHNIDVFGKVFDNNTDKTMRFLIYTAPTSNYTSQGYYPPSDRLILATLSTALRSDAVDTGIVIWRNTDSHAITDYLSNQNNSKFLSSVSLMEELQLKDENSTEKLVRDFASAIQEEEDEVASGEEEEGEGGGADENDEEVIEQEDEISKDESEDGESDSDGGGGEDRPWLGLSITDLTPDLAEDRRLPRDSKGIAVQSVIPGSPASVAGISGILLDVDKEGYLITRGDVIISIDGKEIGDVGDLEDIMEDKNIGDLINFGLNRNGNVTNVTVKLEPLPK